MKPVHTLPLFADRQPPELLVHDEIEPCPYLPDREARFPLRFPIRRLRPEELDGRLSLGDRRHGALLYRPTCPTCHACEAIRIDVRAFEMSKSHRRVVRRAERELRVQVGAPSADPVAVALYDRHRFGRGLARPDSAEMEPLSYERFLVEQCCDSYEMRFFLGEQAVGIAIVDKGADALSAVYCHYDPAFAKYSLGTYSILRQIQDAQAAGRRHLYLGLYVSGCEAMEYKARFLPHERLIDGEWERFSA